MADLPAIPPGLDNATREAMGEHADSRPEPVRCFNCGMDYIETEPCRVRLCPECTADLTRRIRVGMWKLATEELSESPPVVTAVSPACATCTEEDRCTACSAWQARQRGTRGMR